MLDRLAAQLTSAWANEQVTHWEEGAYADGADHDPVKVRCTLHACSSAPYAIAKLGLPWLLVREQSCALHDPRLSLGRATIVAS